MALGAFLAGLLLAETEFSLQVESDIAPYRGLLLGLFFMTVCTSWWQLVVVKLRGELMEREKNPVLSQNQLMCLKKKLLTNWNPPPVSPGLLFVMISIPSLNKILNPNSILLYFLFFTSILYLYVVIMCVFTIIKSESSSVIFSVMFDDFPAFINSFVLMLQLGVSRTFMKSKYIISITN